MTTRDGINQSNISPASLVVKTGSALTIRDMNDVRTLASLAKSLLKGEITAAEIFSGYEHGQVDWLGEAAARNRRSN